MKLVYTLAFTLGITSMLLAQEDPASAVVIGQEDYLANLAGGVACAANAGSLGASGSGEAACSGVDNDDVWFRFTATTQGTKITANTVDFDMVLEVLDAATLTSVACENTNGANAGETLYVSTLVIGADYMIRIHSVDGVGVGNFTFCNEALPAAEVRAGWYPTVSVDLGLPGYKMTEVMKRTVHPNNNLVEGTMWMAVDVDNGDVFFRQVNGVSSVTLLNDFGGICFGKTYDISVQVKVDGFWCGYSVVRQIFTEAMPTTVLEPAYSGQSYNMDQEVKAIAVGSGALLEWRLTTDNGNTVITHSDPSAGNWLYFDEVPCIRYNKIYLLETRVQFCGVWGGYSAPDFVIINPLPYTQLKAEFCGQTLSPAAFVACEFIEVVDQYAWQFAPIAQDDPTMTPIGPAFVGYSVNTNSYQMLPLSLPDGFYRVGVKPMLGVTDNCNDPQEGDYGYFCQIEIQDPAGVAPNQDDDAEDVVMMPLETIMNSSQFSVYPNPAEDHAIATIRGLSLEGDAYLEMYDLTGRQMMSTLVRDLEYADLIQFAIPTDCSSGKYVVVLRGDDFKLSQLIIVK